MVALGRVVCVSRWSCSLGGGVAKPRVSNHDRVLILVLIAVAAAMVRTHVLVTALSHSKEIDPGQDVHHAVPYPM